MFYKYILVVNIIFFISLTACEEVSGPKETDSNDKENSGWLIPENLIFDGGPGKDGIPALTKPDFIPVFQINYLDNNDLVLLYRNNDIVRAYPHPILDWHEIINDELNGKNISVSYCPLTGSGIGYSGIIDYENSMRETTFGVSGLLYNTNLILYDRLTDSYWSQMKLQCVAGELIGQNTDFIPLIETTFGTAKTLFPAMEVVSNSTGVYSVSQYAIYPYGDYKTDNNRLLFPIISDDTRLPRKERVLGVLGDNNNRVYQFKNFTNAINVINDQLGDLPIVVIGSKDLNFIVAYVRRNNEGEELNFTNSDEKLPAVMKDDKDNIYDLFGKVISGPDLEEQLEYSKSFMAFWFSFGAFYPGIDIYQE